MKRIFLKTICLFLFVVGLGEIGLSQKQGKIVKKKKGDTTVTLTSSKESEYDKLFEEAHEVLKGLITLHKMKGKLYFEFPVSVLGREMLIGSTISETSDNAGGLVGTKPSDPLHVMFTRQNGYVQLRRVGCDYVTDNQNSNMAKAIEKSSIGAIMKNMKILAYNLDSTAVVFEMTDFFVSHHAEMSPFDPWNYYYMVGLKCTESYRGESSFLGEVKSFSDNVIIRSHLSYNYTLTNYKGAIVAKDIPLTAVMTRSIVLLKEKPYRPRLADYRIGIFNTGKYFFGEKEQLARTVFYANRWKLEPSDMEAYTRGEKVEPKEPIVFYIDDAFPEAWRPYVKEGVAQWSELFETVGFKNAIVAKDFPKNDSMFDPDNIKYSCVRYAPIPIANAMGPSWVDPRSGEIINASVYLYHDIIKLLNNWMFVQISPANERVRSTKLPDDIFYDGLRYVVAHEVGHCLGFMHNMSGSSVFPVDSLRSPSFTQKYGTTTSIMDYARFNYVAQPGDGARGVKLTPPRFGEYDKHLIEWNYKVYPASRTAEEEAVILSEMLTQRASQPVYHYGVQLRTAVDPRTQSEDLGNDAVKATTYGIANLKYILANMNAWLDAEDKDYSYRTGIFDQIVLQYFMYMNHLFASVGGIYLNEVKVGDPLLPYQSVPKEKQRASLKYMMEQVRNLGWLDDKKVLQNLTVMGSPKELLQMIMSEAIVLAPQKVMLSAALSDEPYGYYECGDDVFDFVWDSAKSRRKLTEFDKFIQNMYLDHMLTSARLAYTPAPSRGLTSDFENVLEETSLFSLLKNYDVNGRYSKLLDEKERGIDFNPIAGFGGYSTKFVRFFNQESNAYYYVMRTKKLLETAVANTQNLDVQMHYRLLLRKVNKSLDVK